ncbi:hypothetical protein OH77DRAFT_1427614 [Trametes cingulata]|nr:hypothetical protein OH77DRAFT_1427614 [Trametes cingulata]
MQSLGHRGLVGDGRVQLPAFLRYSSQVSCRLRLASIPVGPHTAPRDRARESEQKRWGKSVL